MSSMRKTAVAAVLTLASLGGAKAVDAADPITTYRSEKVDGISIFFREAGPSNAPTILLLHGFPSSSHMFRDLIPKLAIRYHVVAPDYPGFGYSDAPSHAVFNPTFDDLTRVMEDFVEQRGIKRATMYLQDFGGPVGFRMAVDHPEWVDALVIQNANAYVEGLAPNIKEATEARAKQPAPVDQLSFELGKGLTDLLYLQGASNPSRISPDSWNLDLWAMGEPGHKEIAAALLNDYQSNVDDYPRWQAYLRKYQPKTLVLWGRGDPVFLPSGAEAFRRDLKSVQITYFDAGHFALEQESGAMATEILAFLDAQIAR